MIQTLPGESASKTSGFVKKFTRSLERHKGVVFATTTKDGVGALHFRCKIPYYLLKRACDALGVSIHSHTRHKNHLMLRNKRGELAGTLVNLNLLLLPKYAKTKGDSVELAQSLLELIP